jgi:hypothetical protein
MKQVLNFILCTSLIVACTKNEAKKDEPTPSTSAVPVTYDPPTKDAPVVEAKAIDDSIIENSSSLLFGYITVNAGCVSGRKKNQTARGAEMPYICGDEMMRTESKRLEEIKSFTGKLSALPSSYLVDSLILHRLAKSEGWGYKGVNLRPIFDSMNHEIAQFVEDSLNSTEVILKHKPELKSQLNSINQQAAVIYAQLVEEVEVKKEDADNSTRVIEIKSKNPGLKYVNALRAQMLSQMRDRKCKFPITSHHKRLNEMDVDKTSLKELEDIASIDLEKTKSETIAYINDLETAVNSLVSMWSALVKEQPTTIYMLNLYAGMTLSLDNSQLDGKPLASAEVARMYVVSMKELTSDWEKLYEKTLEGIKSGESCYKNEDPK